MLIPNLKRLINRVQKHLILGEEELENNKISFKDLRTNTEQETLTLQELKNKLSKLYKLIMANFFSASQEEQQEILLPFGKDSGLLLGFLAIAVIVGRDFYFFQ